MKKIFLVGAACVAVLVMTGCMSTHTNDGTAAVKFCVTKNYTADVVAGKTAVSGEATVKTVLGLISWGVSQYADEAFVSSNAGFQLFASPDVMAKQGATYKACTAAKADSILAAKYVMDIKNFVVYKEVKCKVTGFPATVKGVNVK